MRVGCPAGNTQALRRGAARPAQGLLLLLMILVTGITVCGAGRPVAGASDSFRGC